MTKDNEDALRCAETLRQLDSAKKHHPSGPGGQMMGCESYRLIASGFSFYELQNSADHLDRLVAENEEKESALKIVEATCDDFANQIEAKDALLRQAVEVWDSEKSMLTTIIDIRQHLEGRG